MRELPPWAASIHHDGSPAYLDGAGAPLGASVRVRLRVARDAPVSRVLLRTAPDGEQILTPLAPAGDDGVSRWWEGELRVGAPRTAYRFWLQTDAGGLWLTAAGLARHTPTDRHDFRLLAGYRPPSWLARAVFYQIFPDRFADGDPATNVRSGEYHYEGRPVVARAWGELPRRADGPLEFYGGDLRGIAQRLGYIEELGATALYLNPIFTAPSSHRYDVADYFSVDPHLGGDGALAELRRALDERGMRLVLDIVPNHCGATCGWFLDAQADPAVPEAAFFTFRRHPDEYECWFGIPSLPKLDYRSALLRERMYAGEGSAMRRWLREPFRIDGWRLDVANMLARQGESQLGHKVGRALRRAVKGESPEAYILGENFYDGTAHLQGDELDATMNYSGFTLPLLEWLAGVSIVSVQLGEPPAARLPTADLAAQWREFMAGIPWQVATQQLNLLGSHDTPRILTVLGGDRALLRVASALLFTFPGVPSVYYGDEVGLEGGGDPDCRRCMPWDERDWDVEIRDHYRRLAHLRRTAPALYEGGFQLLRAEGETVAFQREAPGQRLLVVARRAPDGLAELGVRAAGVPDGARLRELLGGGEAQVAGGRLPLAGLGAPGVQVWEEIR